MSRKVYVLSIEYNEDTEEVEYIQEEILDKDDLEKATQIVKEVNDNDYWDKESVQILKELYDGEIGES
tara:strand:+ start:1181 stop:1384 length:204 start_codon:yes stop_codon:yes gene_type:complete